MGYEPSIVYDIRLPDRVAVAHNSMFPDQRVELDPETIHSIDRAENAGQDTYGWVKGLLYEKMKAKYL